MTETENPSSVEAEMLTEEFSLLHSGLNDTYGYPFLKPKLKYPGSMEKLTPEAVLYPALMIE